MIAQKFKRFMAKLTAVSVLALTVLPFLNMAHAAGATLRVSVVPAQASYNIYDGNINLIPGSPYAGNQIFMGMPQGSYTVEFLPLAGYANTPGTETVTLFDGDDEEVVGIYTNDPPTGGTLAVNVTPNNGTYNLYDGNLNLIAGSPYAGDQLFGNMPQGSYTVEFLPLAGYNLPNPATVTEAVVPNQTTTINGVYTVQGAGGTLIVDVTPNTGSYNVYDGNLALMAGSPFTGDTQFDDLPQGSYTVEFLPLAGYDLPNPATVTETVNLGQTVTVEGIYTVQGAGGTLIVDVTPEQGSYNIYDGNLNLMPGSPFTGDSQHDDLVQGSYTVEFLPLGGYELPNPATATVTINPGQTETVTGVYTLATITGRVIVHVEDDQGNAFTSADYDILLDGSVIYANQTQTFDELNQSAGVYTINARTVNMAGVDYTPAVNQVSVSNAIVNQNDEVQYLVTYTPVTVTGNVIVTLEDGAGNAFGNPGDYDIEWNGNLTYPNLTADSNLTDQPAGQYTVTARPVVVGGTTYNPNVVRESVSDTIAVQGDTVEYRIEYTTNPITGNVVVTLEDGAGNAFANPGDYDILLNGAVTYTETLDVNYNTQPAGTYTIAARPVTVGGTTYAPAVTLESADNVLDTQNETIEFRIDYVAAAVTGNVIVTLEDGAGNAFGNPGDYDIEWNGALTYPALNDDVNLASQPAGVYTLTARNITVGGTIYTPAVILESASNAIAAQGDTVEYRIDYLAPPVTGRVVVTLEDGLGGAFGNAGDFDILLDGAMAHAGLIADFDQTGEPAGVYTVAARPVTVGGTTYAPNIVLESADNTLDVQDEVIEYRIDYTASPITGRVVVTLEDGLGGAFANPGDFDILYNANPAYVFQTADFDQLLQPAGAYTLVARNVTAGGTTYSPVIVLESTLNTIVAQDDVVEYRIDYVVSNPDLTLAKSVNVATTEPGQTLTYTLRYGNDGALAAGNATGVTILDNYDETRLTNIILNDPNCTDDGAQITCALGNLAPGATGLTLTYTGVVAMGLLNGDLINNTATITSIEADANPADNTASASVTVIPPEVTVTKTVNPAQVTGDGQWVDYTITVARTNMTIPGSITATVRDTITNTGRVNGTQGGVMVFVPGGPSDTTCAGVVCTGATTGSLDPNLEEEAIEVALDNVGSTATITYRLMSGVSGPGYNPAVGTSMINTASVTYPGLASPLTAQAVVSVPAQTVIVDPGTPSGGGGGGGSYVVKKGDMKLEIEKLVSRDGVNYQNADSKPMAMVVPENKSTRLFYKVTVKNLGQVSAADIKFDHFFDEGKSDLTADDVNDLVGARWDNNGELMIVDRVKVGETYTFTYNVLVQESGSNPNPAIDGLELTSFGSKLPRMQDGLTYLGIGDKIQSYIYGGRIPANVEDEQVYNPIPSMGDSFILDIKVRADRAEAAVGDVVNFIATLTNKTDTDLTNLFINHDYDSNAFEVASAIGASDNGRSLSWKRALLRPGEVLTLNFSLRVKAGAPVNTTVHNLTRALVSEYEGLVPYESLVYIMAGPSTTVEPGRGFELAQTGPMGWMELLMLIAGLAYLSRIGIRHARYVRGKKLALQSL
ncbi:hypothetical protein JW752_03825 [Candidatus Peregrinibacteria bacterium]|nr:hypothetical protein [Candidatus Peregrinibacteria bacterium]